MNEEAVIMDLRCVTRLMCKQINDFCAEDGTVKALADDLVKYVENELVPRLLVVDDIATKNRKRATMYAILYAFVHSVSPQDAHSRDCIDHFETVTEDLLKSAMPQEHRHICVQAWKKANVSENLQIRQRDIHSLVFLLFESILVFWVEPLNSVSSTNPYIEHFKEEMGLFLRTQMSDAFKCQSMANLPELSRLALEQVDTTCEMETTKTVIAACEGKTKEKEQNAAAGMVLIPMLMDKLSNGEEDDQEGVVYLLCMLIRQLSAKVDGPTKELKLKAIAFVDNKFPGFSEKEDLELEKIKATLDEKSDTAIRFRRIIMGHCKRAWDTVAGIAKDVYEQKESKVPYIRLMCRHDIRHSFVRSNDNIDNYYAEKDEVDDIFMQMQELEHTMRLSAHGSMSHIDAKKAHADLTRGLLSKQKRRDALCFEALGIQLETNKRKRRDRLYNADELQADSQSRRRVTPAAGRDAEGGAGPAPAPAPAPAAKAAPSPAAAPAPAPAKAAAAPAVAAANAAEARAAKAASDRPKANTQAKGAGGAAATPPLFPWKTRLTTEDNVFKGCKDKDLALQTTLAFYNGIEKRITDPDDMKALMNAIGEIKRAYGPHDLNRAVAWNYLNHFTKPTKKFTPPWKTDVLEFFHEKGNFSALPAAFGLICGDKCKDVLLMDGFSLGILTAYFVSNIPSASDIRNITVGAIRLNMVNVKGLPNHQ